MPKTNPDPKTIVILKEVSQKFQLFIQELENSEEIKKKSFKNLKVNLRLFNSKKKDITNESVKTLTITWKDNQKYSDFTRYDIGKSQTHLPNKKQDI